MSAGAAYRLAWPYVVYGAIVVAFFASTYGAVTLLGDSLVTTKLGQRALGQSSRVVYTANRLVLDAVRGGEAAKQRGEARGWSMWLEGTPQGCSVCHPCTCIWRVCASIALCPVPTALHMQSLCLTFLAHPPPPPPAPSQNTTARPEWQAQLATEAALMHTLWERLLYGGDTLPDAAADGAADSGQGAAFTHKGAVGPFYTDKGCVRPEASTCLPAGDPYYEVSRAGINALAVRLVGEARLLAADDPATIAPTSSR
jgi:hypothetical protein